MLSASKELEPGARAMLLFAEDLFRLDVVFRGDTLRTIVRNLSHEELTIDHDASADSGVSIALGSALEYEPGRASLGFSLGTGGDRVQADVVIATLRHAARGTVQVTAQAIVQSRPGEAPA